MASLKIKTAKNLGIVYGANLITRIFGMIATIILARLLTPADFGLVALSGIVIAIVLLFQDFGLGAALVQRQKDIEEAVNVVFYSTIFIKFILYLIIKHILLLWKIQNNRIRIIKESLKMNYFSLTW